MAMVGTHQKRRRWLGLYLPLTFFTVFLLFPFYWMLIVSLKPNADLLDTAKNPFLLTSVTLDHYSYLFTDTAFVRYTINTLVVTVGATVLSLSASILIGYALGRFRFRGGSLMGAVIFLAYLVPPTLLFI